MSNSEVENVEMDAGDDENVKKVVKLLMAETYFLRQIIATKMISLENLKNDTKEIQEREMMLRLKLAEECEHVRTENEYLHKAVNLLEQHAYELCEENRQQAIAIENQKQREAEMILKQNELESELKKYRENIIIKDISE